MENQTLYRYIKYIFVCLAGILFLSSCDKELNEVTEKQILKKLSTEDMELIRASNNFSLDLLKQSYQLQQNDNLLVSPLGVGMTVGMIYNGVGPKEKENIQAIMGMQTLAGNEMNKSYNDLLSFIQMSDHQLDISCANAIWFPGKLHIDENYRTMMMAYYDAEISEINFGKPAALETINNWGQYKTGGHFNQLLAKNPPQNTDLLLLNAFGLNVDLNQNVDVFLAQRPFQSGNGKISKIKTYNLNALKVKMNQSEELTFLEIPLQQNQFQLALLMPGQSKDFSSILNHLDLPELTDLDASAVDFKANISLPDLDFYAQKSMKPVLSSMGMGDILSASADFSPSFEETHRYISAIDHKVQFRINAIPGMPLTDPAFNDPSLSTVLVNRPFVYFVRDQYTNTILFAGYYMQPGE